MYFSSQTSCCSYLEVQSGSSKNIVHSSPYHVCVFLYFLEHTSYSHDNYFNVIGTNSIVCYLGASFDKLIFLLVVHHIFLLLSCLIIFDWMPDVLNFSLLGAGFSFSLKNTRELCAGVQIDYLEVLGSF